MNDGSLPATIGHYRVLHPLGAGGMGVVLAAHDERLGRQVALKLVRRDWAASGGDARLWREARAAAAVRHPAICQIFEIGEADQQLFIAMEWIDGETLAARLGRGPLPLSEAVAFTLALLDALTAIHSAGLLHRDLKPSNLMITQHGLKVLDFGLSRPVAQRRLGETAVTAPITEAGILVGTPAYMAPELLEGRPADARSDVFAAGTILFEMLAGRPAFAGATPIALAHAVMYDQPPALIGSPSIAAVDRVVRRALEKPPLGRFATAAEFAEALRAIRRPEHDDAVIARPARRLIVLPFRAMRPDPDSEFLCASLPESVAATLSKLDSIVVRSTLVAARFGSSPDPQRLATEADVDVALTGTLFRAGDDVRVSAQLVEVPGGTLLQSCVFQSASRNVFELHDAIVQQLVDALGAHLTAREDARLRGDVPASHTAYELFLRANELSRDRRRLGDAIERYRQSLAIDSGFAPAWAELGQMYRLRSKYDTRPAEHLARAREAFERALTINPELDRAHAYYAQLEADTGQVREAMLRLLARATVRGGAPEIYAGLVYSCRFCGLSDESLTFHHEARRLDPTVPTSVTQTYFQMGDYLRCLETAAGDIGYITPCALEAMGRHRDAVDRLRRRVEEGVPQSGGGLLVRSLLATLDRQAGDALMLMREFLDSGFIGCEAQAYIARQLVFIGEHEEGVRRLAASVDAGFSNASWFERDRWFDAVRHRQDFTAVVAQAREQNAHARAAFHAAGGDDLLARAHESGTV